MSDAGKKVGGDNAKTPDSDVQGTKAGKKNRADTAAGIKPPPAGEARSSDRATPKAKDC